MRVLVEGPLFATGFVHDFAQYGDDGDCRAGFSRRAEPAVLVLSWVQLVHTWAHVVETAGLRNTFDAKAYYKGR